MTIQELIEVVSKGKKFYFYTSVFLDAFYEANNEERYRLIKTEPKKYDNVNQFYYCNVAGIVHKLANDYNISVPKWVHKEEYKLDEPYYQKNTNNEFLKDYYKKVSPYEFQIRNIFVDSNSLDRV